MASEDQITTNKGLVIERYAVLGVGKYSAGDIYIHRQYSCLLPDQVALREALERLPLDFEDRFNVIRAGACGSFTFFISNDFDTAHEPVAGDYIRVDETGVLNCGFTRNLWHHKWLWVKEDYRGFDPEESRQRSLSWVNLPNVDLKRIATPSYWMKVVPRLYF